MKISNRKGSWAFFYLVLVIFLSLLFQLIWGLALAKIPAFLILIRLIVLIVLAGLLAFLWWLTKEAED